MRFQRLPCSAMQAGHGMHRQCYCCGAAVVLLHQVRLIRPPRDGDIRQASGSRIKAEGRTACHWSQPHNNLGRTLR